MTETTEITEEETNEIGTESSGTFGSSQAVIFLRNDDEAWRGSAEVIVEGQTPDDAEAVRDRVIDAIEDEFEEEA